MAGLNKLMLIGRLGKDPEIRYLPNGQPVANFSVATSRTWKDKDSGEKREKTEWHHVVVYGKAAETIGEYAKKGTQIYLEGRVETRKWQDKNGVDRYSTEMIANNFQFLGKGGGSSSKESSQQEQQTEKAAEFDDDIPF